MSTSTFTATPESLNKTAERIVEAIDRPNQASNETFQEQGTDVWLPKMDLPGFGDPYDDCGDDIPHFCDDCGHTFSVGRTCKRSVCPRCAPAWVLDRAPGIVGRLDTVAKVMSARTDEPVYKHHVVLSPPDDWALEAEDTLEKTLEVVSEILSIMDAEGMVAYHPWAGKEGRDGDDRGEWKKRLFNDRAWEGDVRDELTARGHFHAVVASPHIPGGETISQVYNATGWVIKRVTKRDNSGRSLSDLEDVARAVTYSLSHVGINTDRDGNNAAAYRKYGTTWHDMGVDVYDSTEAAADRAVREVAPRTLGIPAKAVRCERQVSESARSDDGLRLDYEVPDGSGDIDPAADTDDLDDDELVACSGKVEHIRRAPERLRDPKWVAKASRAGDVAAAYRRWLTDDPPD